jgi:ZIP family zinc transporter
MASLGSFLFVFLAGLVTALATGLGALPYFVVDDVSRRWRVGLWGLASGIMVSASVFGLIDEALAYGGPVDVAPGLVAGVVLVVVANRALHRFGDSHDHDEFATAQASALARRNWRKLILILGVLTVHSFPEGVAVGVSFAELGLEGGMSLFGFSVPLLAVFMTVAISIHNIPEGLAISIPIRALGVERRWMVGAAVFSSLPQPLGAVVAYGFVTWAKAFLPVGFGFAAGAMIYLVASEFVPEALETGSDLPGGGHRELVAGLAAGVLSMLPLLLVQT